MKSSQNLILSPPLRSAIGTFAGTLKEVTAADLGAAAIKAAIARSPKAIETVVMGNVVQVGARMAVDSTANTIA